MEKKNILTFIGIIISSTFFLLFLSKLTVFGIHPFLRSDKAFLNNTEIGSVNVSSLKESDAIREVNVQINNWKEKSNIHLAFLDKNVELAKNVFEFDVSATFQSIRNTKENPLIVEINKNELVNEIRQLGMESILDEIDVSQLSAVLQQYAANLSDKGLELNMKEYLKGFVPDKQEVLSSVEITMNNQELMHEWVNEHKTIVISPKSLFSFQKLINTNESKSISVEPESAAMIASALYKAILQTDLQVVERNISQRKPSNIPLGFEANIQKDMDLKFYNQNNYRLRIVSKKIDFNKMRIMIIGPMEPLMYDTKLENENIYPQRTIVEYASSPDLEKTVKGRSGISIDVYKEVYFKQKLLDRQLISNDFYLPIDDIEYKYISHGNSLQNNDSSNIHSIIDNDNKVANDNNIEQSDNRNNK